MHNARWLAAIALVAAFTGIAHADSVSLYTAPMTLSAPRVLVCAITNVGDQTRTVTIMPNGAPGTPNDLAPGQSAALSLFPNPGCTDGGCPAYCAFAVQGGKHAFRAAICLYDSQENPLACLPAE